MIRLEDGEREKLDYRLESIKKTEDKSSVREMRRMNVMEGRQKERDNKAAVNESLPAVQTDRLTAELGGH